MMGSKAEREGETGISILFVSPFRESGGEYRACGRMVDLTPLARGLSIVVSILVADA